MEVLQSQTLKQYGEQYQEHLLEQYKLYVATSQQLSERRQNANNYLLTLNSSLVTLYVFALASFGHHHWNALIPFTGLFVCFIWYSLVDSYKDLNTAKFKVIHEMEEQLPVALFRHEWHVCGYGKGKRNYVPLTHLERWVPVAFSVLYAVLIGFALLAPTQASKAPSNSLQNPPAANSNHDEPATGHESSK